MTGLSLLLLLLAPPQDPKKADEAADRAKRAAIVDKVMAEPLKPAVPRPARVDDPVPAMDEPGPDARQIQMKAAQVREQRAALLQRQAAKRVTLELKAITAEEAAAQQDQANGRVGVRNINELALSQDNFDRWLFDDNLSDEARRHRLNALLSDKIHAIEMDRKIGDEQLRRLRLAGDGDIKRFLDRVEAARAEFDVVRQDYTAGRIALGVIESLAPEYKAGPFGSDSLFEKTLRKLRSDKNSASPEGK